jgi:L-histidine N-alpha-methyltransferase
MSELAEAVDSGEERAVARLRDEVWERLRSRVLSPRWFYDHRGSELFEEITRLPEYYPTRTELALLEAGAHDWVASLRPGVFVELGAGSARKTRVLLDALQDVRPGAVYVPLDVSAAFLASTAEALRKEYPSLRIEPEVADLTRPLRLDRHGEPPTLFALLGSTLGNFAPPAAVAVLSHVRDAMVPGDTFLLGADLRPGPGKSVAELEAAYDDAAGVTARFNLNMLAVLNERAGTDFDLDDFRHRAFYEPDAGWIEMHLDAPRGATVRVPGRGTVTLEPGASLRTEISSKYDRDTLDALFAGAGLRRREWITDPRGRYAMVFAELDP